MYTKHGHHIPGTVQEAERPSKVARCLKFNGCEQCMKEREGVCVTFSPEYFDEDFTITARELVKAEIIHSFEDLDKEAPLFTTRVVWATKVLRNWKAVVISDLPGGLIHEVTYDGEKKQTYIDTYSKITQTVIRDGD